MKAGCTAGKLRSTALTKLIAAFLTNPVGTANETQRLRATHFP
jgi:predicted protein tyrosine phosphatase